MKITVYLSNDLTKFCGTVDDKEFNYTVEEFIALIGAFQQAAAKSQNIDLEESSIIPIENIINTI